MSAGILSEADPHRPSMALTEPLPGLQDIGKCSARAVQYGATCWLNDGGGQVVTSTTTDFNCRSCLPATKQDWQRRSSLPDSPHIATGQLSDTVAGQAVRDQHKDTSRENVSSEGTALDRRHGRRSRFVQPFKQHGSLITEDHQRHLWDLVIEDGSDADRTTSLGLLQDQMQDMYSIDNLLTTSHLLSDSLRRRKYSEDSLKTTSSNFPRTRDDRGHSISSRQEGRKPPIHAESRKTRSSRYLCSKVGCSLPEDHSRGRQYRYITKCTCRGSPSSTPRRRPRTPPQHVRKTHSYGSSQRHLLLHPYRPSSTVPKDDRLHYTAGPAISSKSKTTANDSEPRWARSVVAPSRSHPHKLQRLPSPDPFQVAGSDNTHSLLDHTTRYPRARARCRHHGYGHENGKRAASWPRAELQEPRAGCSNSGACPFLPAHAVCAEDVVRLWLMGQQPIEENCDKGHDLPRNVNKTGKTFLEKRRGSESYSSHCSVSVELGDEDSMVEDRGVEVCNFEHQTLQLPLSSQCSQNTQHRVPSSEKCQRPFGEQSSFVSCGPCPHTNDERLSDLDNDDKMKFSCSPLASAFPLLSVERTTLTSCTTAEARHCSKQGTKNKLLPAHGQTALHSTGRQHDFQVHDLNVTFVGPIKSKSKVISHDPLEGLAKLPGPGHASPLSVPDGSVCLSTAEERNGSRSNAQSDVNTVAWDSIQRTKTNDLHIATSAGTDSSQPGTHHQDSHHLGKQSLQLNGADVFGAVQVCGLIPGENHSVALAAEESLV